VADFVVANFVVAGSHSNKLLFVAVLLFAIRQSLPFIVVAVFVVADSHSNKSLFAAVLLFAIRQSLLFFTSRYSPFAAVHHRG
jgi:hypothetical protein